ncbi:hypothetical protein chiPu_0007796 [Chiloscyllium punctatum]|uniref:Uncharacterized protein n=1 Tax=Chiloscyllium punctatum TaxID=137246 RepID=A0A401SG19_CHIPU|nr:hypothetical protein [Chiloscyllium punctatum]
MPRIPRRSCCNEHNLPDRSTLSRSLNERMDHESSSWVAEQRLCKAEGKVRRMTSAGKRERGSLDAGGAGVAHGNRAGKFTLISRETGTAPSSYRNEEQQHLTTPSGTLSSE